MFAILVVFIGFGLSNRPLLAGPADAPRPFAHAIKAMQAGRWDNAMLLAARAGPAAVDMIEWYRLRAGKGTFDEVHRFLAKHSDWPGLKLLRRRSETSLVEASNTEIIAYFRETLNNMAFGMRKLSIAARVHGTSRFAAAFATVLPRSPDFRQTPPSSIFARGRGWRAP
ncbi:MAG: hypothetical protein Q9M48_16010 [Rhodobacterales bacterium]|nr:hypothetical protein [Rhodobacterales bacterium]